MVHLFAHKFSGLRRCRFALPPVTPGPFESLFFWHNILQFPIALFENREAFLNGVYPSAQHASRKQSDESDKSDGLRCPMRVAQRLARFGIHCLKLQVPNSKLRFAK